MSGRRFGTGELVKVKNTDALYKQPGWTDALCVVVADREALTLNRFITVRRLTDGIEAELFAYRFTRGDDDA